MPCPPPPFRVTTKRGHVIEVQTEAEMAALAKILGITPEPSGARAPVADKLAPERALLMILKELARRDRPMNTAAVADLAGLRSAKGLASQVRVWTRILEPHGFEVADAVTRFRDHDSYYWEAGPGAAKVIAALEGGEVKA